MYARKTKSWTSMGMYRQSGIRTKREREREREQEVKEEQTQGIARRDYKDEQEGKQGKVAGDRK